MKDFQKLGLSELDSDTQRKTKGGGLWILPILNFNDSLRGIVTFIQGYLDADEVI